MKSREAAGGTGSLFLILTYRGRGIDQARKGADPFLFLSFSIKKAKKVFWRNVKTTIFAIPKTDTLSAKTFRGKDR